MKQIQKGFTLIELMIVVAIVGILAAIALPAYQDFVVRSKMSEGTAALAACKTSVQDFISSHRAPRRPTPRRQVARRGDRNSSTVASPSLAAARRAPIEPRRRHAETGSTNGGASWRLLAN